MSKLRDEVSHVVWYVGILRYFHNYVKQSHSKVNVISPNTKCNISINQSDFRVYSLCHNQG